MTTRQNELFKKKEQIFRITFFFFVLFQIFYEIKFYMIHFMLSILQYLQGTSDDNGNKFAASNFNLYGGIFQGFWPNL